MIAGKVAGLPAIMHVLNAEQVTRVRVADLRARSTIF